MASTIERNTRTQPNNQNISDPEWVHNARMEEYRKVLYSGAEVPESDVIAEPAPKKAPMFADSVPVQAPSAAERLAQYHPVHAPSSPRNLFEDVALKNGELVSVVPNAETVFAPAAVAPAKAAVAPAPVVLPEADDADARPTPRTMAALNARTEMQQGFFASLSTRTKVVLAAIAAAIVLIIALICINTAIINSFNATNADKQAILNEIQEQSESIRKTIEEITNSDYINEWAESIGMSRS